VISTEVQGGLTYQFKVRARNIHGWADLDSDPVSIKAAQVPDQMTSVVTSIDSYTGGVKLEWTEPHDGFQQIESYLIEIEDVT
jgi:hypothetical protein